MGMADAWRMNTGQIISGVGHVGLIAWAVFGGAFQGDPLPFEVTEVTAISAEDYAALVAGDPQPDAVANVDTPEPPQEGQSPAIQSEADQPPEVSPPEVAETPPPDTRPEITDPAPPEAEVSDEPPVMQPPAEDTAVLVPEISESPQPRPAPRVAPEPVARPEPDVQIDDQDRQQAAPDETAPPQEEDRQETAREEAATEIVTEAEEALAAAAPSVSRRPPTRPTRPAEAPAAEPQPAPTDEASEDAVADAIAEALSGTTDGPADTAPQGPPLTAGERDALRVAVQQCWNVGSLSTEALGTTVVVAVSMFEDGRPDTGTIRMLDFSGGSASAADQAFAAARRAIIRCGHLVLTCRLRNTASGATLK
jgi:hypothetical protein